MNLNDRPSRDQLREFLAQGDDSAGRHVLWVAKDGEVRLTTLPRGESDAGFAARHTADLQMRYETFEPGNGYIGPDAADDPRWVNELFETLLREWGRVKGTQQVEYVELS